MFPKHLLVALLFNGESGKKNTSSSSPTSSVTYSLASVLAGYSSHTLSLLVTRAGAAASRLQNLLLSSALYPVHPAAQAIAGAASGRAPARGVGPVPNTALALQAALGVFWQQHSGDAGVLPEKPHGGLPYSEPIRAVSGMGMFYKPRSAQAPQGTHSGFGVILPLFSLFCSICVSEQSLISCPQLKGVSKAMLLPSCRPRPGSPGATHGLQILIRVSRLQEVPAAGRFP